MQDYTAIKDVVSICRDAEQGFRGAANAVKTPALRTLFEQYSIQRGEFANELIQAGRSMGIEVANASGIGGLVHAGWIELKGLLSGHSEHQILIETERGEDMSLKAYRQALAMNLSTELRAILERQAEQVRQGHDRIRALRDSTASEKEKTEVERSHPAQ